MLSFVGTKVADFWDQDRARTNDWCARRCLNSGGSGSNSRPATGTAVVRMTLSFIISLITVTIVTIVVIIVVTAVATGVITIVCSVRCIPCKHPFTLSRKFILSHHNWLLYHSKDPHPPSHYPPPFQKVTCGM